MQNALSVTLSSPKFINFYAPKCLPVEIGIRSQTRCLQRVAELSGCSLHAFEQLDSSLHVEVTSLVSFPWKSDCCCKASGFLRPRLLGEAHQESRWYRADTKSVLDHLPYESLLTDVFTQFTNVSDIFNLARGPDVKS